MYIVTDALTNSIRYIFENIHPYKDGIYSELPGGTKHLMPGIKHYFLVGDVPEYVEPDKYCYTEEAGLYPNPRYTEPNKWNLPNEVIEEIKNEAIAEVQEGAKNGKM